MEKGTHMKSVETGNKQKKREKKQKEPSKITVSYLTAKWLNKLEWLNLWRTHRPEAAQVSSVLQVIKYFLIFNIIIFIKYVTMYATISIQKHVWKLGISVAPLLDFIHWQ